MDALKGLKFDSPRGPIEIDPATRDIVQTVYIRKTERVKRRTGERRVRQVLSASRTRPRKASNRHAAGRQQQREIHGNRDLRRGGLRHAPVPHRGGPVHHDGPHELRQPRARHVRDGRRLRRECSDEPLRRGLLPVAGGGLRRRRRWSARCWSSCFYLPALPAPTRSTRCCCRSASCSSRSPCSPYFFGLTMQAFQLPPLLDGRVSLRGLEVGRYRLFLDPLRRGWCWRPCCGCIGKTRYGAMVRAAVDNQRVAGGTGIHVQRLFFLTFSLGCGLAGPRRRAEPRHARARAPRSRSSTSCTS